MIDKYEQLEKISNLLKKWYITRKEFEIEKKKILKDNNIEKTSVDSVKTISIDSIVNLQEVTVSNMGLFLKVIVIVLLNAIILHSIFASNITDNQLTWFYMFIFIIYVIFLYKGRLRLIIKLLNLNNPKMSLLINFLSYFFILLVFLILFNLGDTYSLNYFSDTEYNFAIRIITIILIGGMIYSIYIWYVIFFKKIKEFIKIVIIFILLHIIIIYLLSKIFTFTSHVLIWIINIMWFILFLLDLWIFVYPLYKINRLIIENWQKKIIYDAKKNSKTYEIILFIIFIFMLFIVWNLLNILLSNA